MINGSALKAFFRAAKAMLERMAKTNRAGIPWRELPARFGDFRIIHTRHMRWSKSGVWERVFKHLSEDAHNEYAMIDSTIVRAHQHSAGAKGGSKSLNALADPRAG